MADKKIKVLKGSRFGDKAGFAMVNGLRMDFAIDQEIEVKQELVDALAAAQIPYEVVGGEEGVPNPSTAPLQDTATREAPAVDPLTANAQDREIPTLQNGDENDGPGIGGAASADIGRDQKEGQLNAEGQGIAAGLSDEDKELKVKEEGDDASGETDETETEDSQTETVAALKERIATIDDKGELQTELDKEKAGANRSTAVSAIETKLNA